MRRRRRRRVVARAAARAAVAASAESLAAASTAPWSRSRRSRCRSRRGQSTQSRDRGQSTQSRDRHRRSRGLRHRRRCWCTARRPASPSRATSTRAPVSKCIQIDSAAQRHTSPARAMRPDPSCTRVWRKTSTEPAATQHGADGRLSHDETAGSNRGSARMHAVLPGATNRVLATGATRRTREEAAPSHRQMQSTRAAARHLSERGARRAAGETGASDAATGPIVCYPPRPMANDPTDARRSREGMRLEQRRTSCLQPVRGCFGPARRRRS